MVRASRWRIICCLFHFFAGGFLLCTMQTANADSRTGVEEKEKPSANEPSAQQTASLGRSAPAGQTAVRNLPPLARPSLNPAQLRLRLT
jgi:hypothetical protein